MRAPRYPAPRRRLAPRAAALALSCGASVGCAAGEVPVLWSGRLVDDPLWVGEITALDAGALRAREPGGAPLAEAEPVEGWAEGLALQLDAGAALALVVEAPGYTTTVWPTVAPEGDAFWLDGALYPRATPVLRALAGNHGEDVALPSDGATAALWIEPDPAAPWGAGLIRIDAAGATRLDLRLSPSGRWVTAADGVPDVILVLNLPPGTVEVWPLPASGASASISLHLEAGELGMLPRLTP